MIEKNQNTYITNEVLQGCLNTVKEEYQKRFIDSYGFDKIDSYWIGHVLFVADYFFDFYDVVYAVDNDINETKLFNWYNYILTLGEHSLGNVCLENYIKGIRPYKESDVIELRRLQEEYNKAKASIDDLLFKMRNENK